MGSGGGGDSMGQMMMTMMMMMKAEEDKRRMQQEQEQQAFQAAQRGENQNFQRYNDLLSKSNKDVGGAWDNYNSTIDKILKINPNWNTAQKYQFNPYTVNPDFKRSTNRQEADENADALNRWYADTDKRALDDLNMAKQQSEAANKWLADVKANQDAGDRVLPGAPPGTWGAGGGMVSGGAGADAEQKPAGAGSEVGGDSSALADVFSGLSGGGQQPVGGSATMSGMGKMGGGSGFLGGNDNAGGSGLGGMFGKAVGMGGGGQKQAGFSIF